MPSSRSFLGSLIPNAININGIYGVDSNGLSMIMQNCAPGNSGGSWEFQVIAISTAANTITALTAVAATRVTQGLTLTAVVNAAGVGTNGNSITIAFTPGAVAGSEVVTVVGTAISVQIATGVSTVTQVRTAMQASVACTALVTTTGTSASTVATAAALALTGGVNTQFNQTTGVITTTTVTGTQFPGVLGRLTTSTGSLPTGFALATNYFLYFPDNSAGTVANTAVTQIQLFSSMSTLNAARQRYRNGIAPVGTTGLIIPTVDGTAGATVTFTPTALSGSTITYQQSNSFTPLNVSPAAGATANVNSLAYTFVNMPVGLTYDTAASQTTNTAALYFATYRAGCAKFVRLLLAVGAGSMLVRCVGYNA